MDRSETVSLFDSHREVDKVSPLDGTVGTSGPGRCRPRRLSDFSHHVFEGRVCISGFAV